jgi:hypothetical protein
MELIEEKSGSWILLRNNDDYYLCVALYVTGAMWDVKFKLDDKEKQSFLNSGTVCIAQIDKKCNANRELYSTRQVDTEIVLKINKTIKEYRSQSQIET